MKTPKNLTLINNIFDALFIMLAGLMPIFFLPLTSEFFELNKLALLIVVTTAMLILWGLKTILTEKFNVTKTPMDLPILLLSLITILATIFSLDRTSSIFGSQGRWFPSLFGYMTIVVFYYATVSNISKTETIKQAIIAFISGATISTVVATLAYYGKYIGSESYFQLPSFTLTGSTTATLNLAALAVALGFAFLVYSQNLALKMLLALACALNFYYIVIVNKPLGWIAFGLFLVLTIKIIGLHVLKSNILPASFLALYMLAMTTATFLPYTKNVLVKSTYPFDINLPLVESWIISASAMRDYPFMGSGVSTFYLDFPRYRPVNLNTGDLWNVRFDKPFNELFNIMATLGVTGVIVALFFGAKALKTALSSKNNDASSAIAQLDTDSVIAKIISLGIILSLLTFLLTYATILTAYLLFMFLAALIIVRNQNDDTALTESVMENISVISALSRNGNVMKIKEEYYQYIKSVPFFALALLGGFLTYRLYLGEIYMRKAIVAALNDQAIETYRYQAKALEVNPQRDTYHNAYAQTNLAMGINIASRQDLTDQDKQVVQSLIGQAIRSVRISTELLSPSNVNGWEARAMVYRAIISAAQDADQWAQIAYENAVKLDRTNPRLLIDYGGYYFNKNDFLTAASLFRQSINLKPDYANAYYNFGFALAKLNDYDNSKKSLEIARALVPQGSGDYERVTADLDAVVKMQEQNSNMANVAGAQTTQTTPTQNDQKNIEDKQKILDKNLPAPTNNTTNQDKLTQPKDSDKAVRN